MQACAAQIAVMLLAYFCILSQTADTPCGGRLFAVRQGADASLFHSTCSRTFFLLAACLEVADQLSAETAAMKTEPTYQNDLVGEIR